ncbi:MAG TPA: heme-binding protein [Ramlibacter sp.]|nr:heme-binding protein [Ramlibacter sp.]
MADLTLAQARRIVDTALAHGRSLSLAPLAVAVLDTRGTLKAFAAEDGTSLLREDIAQGKAWGALGLGFGGRELRRRSQHAPVFFGALQAMSGGRMVPVPGGVLVRDAQGTVVGAVGISGDQSEQDEACAVHGIREAGLVSDTGDAAEAA